MAYIETFKLPRKIPSPNQHRAEPRRGRHCVIDVCPELFDAITELAKEEDLPLPTLVILLINSGLSERLTRRGRRS